jgi:hypothetical protein
MVGRKLDRINRMNGINVTQTILFETKPSEWFLSKDFLHLTFGMAV